MKRLLILGCLCLAFDLKGQDASSTNTAAPPRPPQRFLFLIDTSSGMARQKTVTTDTMSRLILSGVGGRIQTGDIWSLWTIDEQIRTDVVPARRWDPQQRGDQANHVFRYLRDLRFNKKKALLDRALAIVAEEAKFSGTLTVLLFTDGSNPVKGTPFDESINEIFAKHGAGMRKAKKPFVIVLVTQDGLFAAHAVSPGGERIYIPRLPQAMAAAKKPEPTVKENAAAPTPTPTPARPRTLTAEEISELLRQSQKQQSNTLAATPAPLILRGNASNAVVATNEVQARVPTANEITATNTAVADTSAKAVAETLARPPAASAPVSDATASPDRSTVVSTPSPAATPPAVVPPGPSRVEPSAPKRENASTPVDSAGPSTSQLEQPRVSTVETEANDPRESLAHAPALAQTAVLARPDIAPIYLVAAVALLVIASLFAWLYIRSIRYVPRPSIISQSLEKQKK